MMGSGREINKEIISNMSWTKGHPEEEGQYLVCVICTYKDKQWLEVKILTWNPHYACWDDEEGDDNYCEPENIYCWMPLPEKPEIE